MGTQNRAGWYEDRVGAKIQWFFFWVLRFGTIRLSDSTPFVGVG